MAETKHLSGQMPLSLVWLFEKKPGLVFSTKTLAQSHVILLHLTGTTAFLLSTAIPASHLTTNSLRLRLWLPFSGASAPYPLAPPPLIVLAPVLHKYKELKILFLPPEAFKKLTRCQHGRLLLYCWVYFNNHQSIKSSAYWVQCWVKLIYPFFLKSLWDVSAPCSWGFLLLLWFFFGISTCHQLQWCLWYWHRVWCGWYEWCLTL